MCGKRTRCERSMLEIPQESLALGILHSSSGFGSKLSQVEAVKFLAEHGADTDCFVNTGQTALQAATERCHSQVVNFLREAADDVRKPAKRCRLSDQSVAFRCAMD